MANKIRRLLIGKEIKEQHVYFVGGKQNVYIDNAKKEIEIFSIDEVENGYIVNVKFNGEIQEWKRLPKNDVTTLEFYLD